MSLKKISLSFLICALLFSCGCGASGRGGKGQIVKEVSMTEQEKDKSRLLKRINRKFENPEAHFALGKIYHAEGLWTKAEHEYTIVLGFDPVNREAQAARVKVLLDSGDTATSAMSAEFYMNQASSSAIGSLKLAQAFQSHGLDEYALSCYSQALQLAPNSARVTRQIGYYYLSRNDKVRGQEYLSRSFQLDPLQPEVAGELGRLGVGIEVPRKKNNRGASLDREFDKYNDEKSNP